VPGWTLSLLILAGFLAAGLLAAATVDRLNEPSPFVVSSTDAPRRTISVEVEGAVASPGVYELEHGARVADVIDAAGGLTSAGDPSLVDDAAVLQDGQTVFIPEEGGTTAAAAQLVDINAATAEELAELPEIGPVRAQAIVDSREQLGPFAKVEDLVLRGVISLGVYEQIRHLIVVAP
jgi:competence protein ComEA